MHSEVEPPEGYTEPRTVWLVEYVDPREPEEGHFQLGGFTGRREAQKLERSMRGRPFFADLRINSVPIHERIEDWKWDR
jgi:hypothetical protein